MRLRPAATAVLAAALCFPALAQSSPPAPVPNPAAAPARPAVFTLDDALARIDASHPDLRLFGSRRDALAAELDRAGQRPALTAGATLENAFGSGELSGLRGAELSLTLASVFERGGKLDARRTLAQSRIDALAVERESRRLDLLAEAARRYLNIVAAQRQHAIAELDIGQRQRTVAAARQRLQAGASPESVVLTAQAALARAELERERASQRRLAARRHLAALWGERDPGFAAAAGDPLTLPAIQDFDALAELLQRSPEIARFADEGRIREARLQLARTQATPDLEWQFGLRRLQETGDQALLGSVALPLGASRRAAPDIRAAEAELAMLGIEREAQGMSLYSTLADAHGRYQVAALEVRRLNDDVLPKLARAEAAAERAYRAGAISYLEWAQLQSERTNGRKQQLEAALEAQRALIEIQRLTGEAFVAAPAASTAQGTAP
ncbi:TolC family protein [Lysobacter sp. cf310]|uniref:TolC family protein n=1 Tax=Lysobacter sp. cf310 TaxID=1761790 RepID=UPI0008EEFDC6|nr:TolC family protein [Lysobacter sp. cf310]SFK51817.1 outer membrane protein, cobalt-zinc-cadmium efflux system [Lysobacter sp. cf310]